MKNRKLFVSALLIVGCALVAVSLGLPISSLAQQASNARAMQTPPINLNRATSIDEVGKIRSALLEGIDAALAAKGAGETTVANTKLWKDILDKTTYKTTNASARVLSASELKGVREIINARFEEAIRTGNIESLGSGTLSSSIFTGKLVAKPVVTAPYGRKYSTMPATAPMVLVQPQPVQTPAATATPKP